MKSCILCHLQVSNYRKSSQKFRPTINTSRFKYKQLSKVKTKPIHTKSKKKKAQSKTGNTCVLRDGLGSEKLYHMILHLMPKIFQPRPHSMLNKEFQSHKTDSQKLSRHNISTVESNTKNQWSSYLKLHGKNFSFVWIWKISFLTLI